LWGLLPTVPRLSQNLGCSETNWAVDLYAVERHGTIVRGRREYI
jgi:hypothetical protein